MLLHDLLEKTILSLLTCFYTFVENQLEMELCESVLGFLFCYTDVYMFSLSAMLCFLVTTQQALILGRSLVFVPQCCVYQRLGYQSF